MQQLADGETVVFFGNVHSWTLCEILQSPRAHVGRPAPRRQAHRVKPAARSQARGERGGGGKQSEAHALARAGGGAGVLRAAVSGVGGG